MSSYHSICRTGFCKAAVIPKDSQTLKRELPRNFLGYLGVEPKSG